MIFELSWPATYGVISGLWIFIGSIRGIFEINKVKQRNAEKNTIKICKFSLIIYYFYNLLAWPFEIIIDCLSNKSDRTLLYYANKEKRYNTTFFILLGLFLGVKGIMGINSCVDQKRQTYRQEIEANKEIIIGLGEWSDFYLAIKSVDYESDKAKVVESYNFKDLRDLESNEMDVVLDSCYWKSVQTKFLCNYGATRTKETKKEKK